MASLGGFVVPAWFMGPQEFVDLVVFAVPRGFLVLLLIVVPGAAFLGRPLVTKKPWYVQLRDDGVEVCRRSGPVFVKYDSIKEIRDSYVGSSSLDRPAVIELRGGSTVLIDPASNNSNN